MFRHTFAEVLGPGVRVQSGVLGSEPRALDFAVAAGVLTGSGVAADSASTVVRRFGGASPGVLGVFHGERVNGNAFMLMPTREAVN
jgi:hypothetical protein